MFLSLIGPQKETYWDLNGESLAVGSDGGPGGIGHGVVEGCGREDTVVVVYLVKYIRDN